MRPRLRCAGAPRPAPGTVLVIGGRRRGSFRRHACLPHRERLGKARCSVRIWRRRETGDGWRHRRSGFTLPHMVIPNMDGSRQGIGIAGRLITLSASPNVVISRPIEQKRRRAEVDTQRRVIGFRHNTRQGALEEPQGMPTLSFNQRIGGIAEATNTTRVRRRARRTDKFRRRREQRLRIPEDGDRAGFRIVELHAVIERLVLEARTAAIHCGCGGCRDVDDRQLGRH